jgi:hypothetical protein
MKNKKMISIMFVALLLIATSITTTNVFAQTKVTTSMMNDGLMMKDGKMMQMKSGKMMPMHKNMTMTNGTKCMTNGMCIMKDGKKMQMKEGQSMDMNGKMDMGGMMNKDSKSSTNMNSKNHNMAAMYVCPMHPEITSNKPGNCTKCGMALVLKK